MKIDFFISNLGVLVKGVICCHTLNFYNLSSSIVGSREDLDAVYDAVVVYINTGPVLLTPL
jgi:hypothetical protein